MEIMVRGKNIEVTSAMRDHVEKRIGKLSRYLDNIAEAQVVLQVARDRHRVEVTIPLDGFFLRGEEETGDMYASVDLVIEKLEKQVEKYKTRLQRRLRNQKLKEQPPQLDLPPETDDEPKVTRIKRFPIKPMPLEEAIMQMNLLGHSFFVFSNADTEQVNVIYRRKDGNYGLIEPEI